MKPTTSQPTVDMLNELVDYFPLPSKCATKDDVSHVQVHKYIDLYAPFIL